MALTTNQFSMHMDQVVRVVDHASLQSDRWAFFAMLAVNIVFAGLAIWWLNRNSQQQTKLALESTDRCREQYVQHATEFAKVVQHNTDVVGEARAVFAKVEKQIERCGLAAALADKLEREEK